MKTKVCSKCNQLKLMRYFRKWGNRCKACQAAYDKQRYLTHRAEKAENDRKYREDHRVELREYMRQYQKQHREEISANQKRYRARLKQRKANLGAKD